MMERSIWMSNCLPSVSEAFVVSSYSARETVGFDRFGVLGRVEIISEKRIERHSRPQVACGDSRG